MAFTTNDKYKIFIFGLYNLSYVSLFTLPYDFLYQRYPQAPNFSQFDLKIMSSIDFKTLIDTRNELLKINNNEIVDEIIRVLKNNEIKKPVKHNKLNNKQSNHYVIDLKPEHIDQIIELFEDLETGSLDEKYESTSETLKFSKIVDKWTNIVDS